MKMRDWPIEDLNILANVKLLSSDIRAYTMVNGKPRYYPCGSKLSMVETFKRVADKLEEIVEVKFPQFISAMAKAAESFEKWKKPLA